MKIAFIGYKKQERHTVGTQSDEDGLLADFLSRKGLDLERVVWNDPQVDWRHYDVAVLKSPWDYHEFFPEFSSWLNRLKDLGVRLLNPYPVIRWNIDKHYLKDIADADLPVIPSLFLEKGSRPALEDLFTTFGTSKLIVKPCVSAGARNTMMVTAQNLAGHSRQLQTLMAEESYLVQPFVEEIAGGELAFIFFGGKYSHCVMKLPKAGDFRVQHFHGGTVQSYEPTPVELHAATAYVDRYAPGCLYVRVDGVMIRNQFTLMELELIEPYLFLDRSAGSYQRYYEALVNLIT